MGALSVIRRLMGPTKYSSDPEWRELEEEHTWHALVGPWR